MVNTAFAVEQFIDETYTHCVITVPFRHINRYEVSRITNERPRSRRSSDDAERERERELLIKRETEHLMFITILARD